MLRQCCNLTSNISVVRRLLLAANTLPKETPNRWEIVASFAIKDAAQESVLTPEKAKILFENLEYMEKDALLPDDQLLSELHTFVGPKGVSWYCSNFCSSNLQAVWLFTDCENGQTE